MQNQIFLLLFIIKNSTVNTKGMKQMKLIGLTKAEVKQRILAKQVNKINDTQTRTTGQIIKSNTVTLFNFFNVIIAIALLAVHAYTNTFFILIIVINISIGIMQECQARNMIAKLSIVKNSKVKVIRDGLESKIGIEEIVLDDVIVLTMGDQIPSDAIVIDGVIEVNESLLTGESTTIPKKCNDHILSGSYVASGKCYARVEHVGQENFSSRLVRQAKEHKESVSELVSSMTKVTRLTSFVIVPAGILMLIESLVLRHVDMQNSVIFVSAALLGMLPKGLLLLITISLATGVIKLAKKQVLIHDLYSVETLAHVDTLCLDKTGTITEGKMQVTNVEILEEDILPYSFYTLMSAFGSQMEDNNATFNALQEYFQGKEQFSIAHRTPFSSERKWSAIGFDSIGTIIVGAPERLLSLSTVKLPMLETLQKEGKRVLCVAYTPQIDAHSSLPDALTIIGIITLCDPLRKNVRNMMQFFKQQEVDLKVISGDHPLTVLSIAKQAGITDADHYVDLSTVDDAKIEELVATTCVFARVMPHQKSLIVKALQRQGKTVAMTGDGVNDIIALKHADCSITLPEACDVAKQVAQIVLLQDDFTILQDVLMEGRRVVNNVTSVSRIFFIKTFYSIALSLLCIVTNMPFPFYPIQITLIDLAIEGYTSFFLSFRSNPHPITGRFLPTVCRNALPYAITIVIGIVTIPYIASLGITNAQISILLYLFVAGVSMLAVIEVCRPFDWITTFLSSSTVVGFIVAVFLFQNILYLKGISIAILAIAIILVMLGAIVVLLSKYAISAFNKR